MENKHRYGIRKYKIGAASIALGTVVAIGMTEGNEAKASELNDNQYLTTTQQSPHSVLTEQTQAQTNQTAQANLKKNISNKDQTDIQNALQHESAVSNESSLQKDNHNLVSQPQKIVSQPVQPQAVTAPQMLEKEQHRTQHNPSNKGIDVTDKVNVLESRIEGHENKKEITPHNAERVTLKYKWRFDNSIKENDHFDFSISDNVDTTGIAVQKKVPEIKDNENVVARGEVFENNKIRYTFTEYVNYKKDITAQLSLNLFFNPVSVPNEGKQTVTATLGKNETRETFNVKYLEGVYDKTGSGVRINGRIHKLNKNDQNFTHIAYINPDRKNLNSVKVIGYFEKGSAEISRPRSVQVYEYLGEPPLAQSVYADFNLKDYKDITNNVNLYVQKNGNYEITLGDIRGKAYLVKFVGQYSEDAKDLSFATELTGHHVHNGYYRSTKLTWLNGAAFYSNNAQGHGSNRMFTGQSEHVDLTYDTYKPEQHIQNGTLIESYDSKPIMSIIESGTDSGKSNSKITEEIEDSYKWEYITENNLIEFNEDNTLPPTISGQAKGKIEEVEENQHVDIVEITTPMGEQGHAHGSIEEIEENHLIEFDNHTAPSEVQGQSKGAMEEIFEHHLINFMSESGVESGSHEIINFEEDTEKDKPSFKTGAHHPIEFVEDTTLHFDGSNQGRIEEEDTLPNSFVPPITPKEEEPEMPSAPEVPKVNTPKENSEMPPMPKTDREEPKVEKQILPNSPEVNHSKVKNEHSIKTTVVGESPKFKRFNAVQISDSNKMIETRKDVKLKRKALPNTGKSSNKNPVLLGGLMSLFGLILLRRSKKVSK